MCPINQVFGDFLQIYPKNNPNQVAEKFSQLIFWESKQIRGKFQNLLRF